MRENPYISFCFNYIVDITTSAVSVIYIIVLEAMFQNTSSCLSLTNEKVININKTFLNAITLCMPEKINISVYYGVITD